MTIAIMQPYLFPYVGYFQLIHAVDRFVVYDDVNYIKQGWVNRNRLLVNGAPYLFTLPVKNAGSFSLISDVGLDSEQLRIWRIKFMRTVAQAYARAPFREPVEQLLIKVLGGSHELLVDLLTSSLREIMAYIGIRTELVSSSSAYGNQHFSGQERVLDICAREGARRYVNPIGGKELYDRAAFASRSMDLAFLRSQLPEYEQGKEFFVPGLSILDAMMFVPPDQLRLMMRAYDLE